VVRQGLIDIMLCSASNIEQLAIRERLFDGSHITPAARANDATDIGSFEALNTFSNHRGPSAAQRSITSNADASTASPAHRTSARSRPLSVTFTNNLSRDYETLQAFKEFREEAERKNFRYFPRSFRSEQSIPASPRKWWTAYQRSHHPQPCGRDRARATAFLKDRLSRPASDGRTRRLRFESYRRHSGRRRRHDLRRLQAHRGGQKHGARVALFGRKINQSEHPLAFIEMLRRIVEHEITAEEAVRAYHGVLQSVGIPPLRALDEDSKLTSASRAMVALVQRS
jgi:hypothetical protein